MCSIHPAPIDGLRFFGAIDGHGLVRLDQPCSDPPLIVSSSFDTRRSSIYVPSTVGRVYAEKTEMRLWVAVQRSKEYRNLVSPEKYFLE